jgi:hypothetical protein
METMLAFLSYLLARPASLFHVALQQESLPTRRIGALSQAKQCHELD